MKPLPAPIWTAIPEAVAILADIAANPPRERYVRGVLGPHDGEMRFDDARVRRLEEIKAEEQRRILAECDEAKDHTAFYAIVSVRQAVEEAIASLAKSRLRAPLADAA